MTANSNAPSETANQSRASGSAQSLARRALEWLWQGGALTRLRAKQQLKAPRANDFERRAKLCIELGRNVFDPPQPFEWGSARAAACELYRQAIYWALLARQARSAASLEAPASDDATSDAEELPPASDAASGTEKLPAPAVVWASADRALLASLLEPAGLADSVGDALGAPSFADLAELSDERLDALAEGLRKFAESLLAECEAARRDVERVYVRRFVRLSLVAATLAALSIGVVRLHDSYQQSRDVARGKPWLASSLYGVGGCPSPQQQCPESPSYFVHTHDEVEPWLEIDLGQRQRISGIQVANRGDCCHERGLPLVVLVSQDQARWTEVARRTTEFDVWNSSFAPVEARWVRLRVLGRGILHLRGVHVLR